MQLGVIGLGRMGANMVRRLLRVGHQCVVFDRSPQAVEALAKEMSSWPRSFRRLRLLIQLRRGAVSSHQGASPVRGRPRWVRSRDLSHRRRASCVPETRRRT
jgi:glutamyl-tRNA reductase